MIFHEFGDDLVLLNKLGLELLDLAVFGLVEARRPSWPVLERLLGLVEDELDPTVDLAGLEAELISEVGDGLLAAEMTTHDLGLLVGSEVAASLVHGTCLRSDSY